MWFSSRGTRKIVTQRDSRPSATLKLKQKRCAPSRIDSGPLRIRAECSAWRARVSDATRTSWNGRVFYVHTGPYAQSESRITGPWGSRKPYTVAHSWSETWRRQGWGRLRKKARERERERERWGRRRGWKETLSGLMDVWYPRFPCRPTHVSWPRSINGSVIAYLWSLIAEAPSSSPSVRVTAVSPSLSSLRRERFPREIWMVPCKMDPIYRARPSRWSCSFSPYSFATTSKLPRKDCENYRCW